MFLKIVTIFGLWVDYYVSDFVQAVSQSFAKKMDLPQLEYCTIPRTGALDVIMEELGPNATSPIESRITKVRKYLNCIHAESVNMLQSRVENFATVIL